jgi:hypothetical protein
MISILTQSIPASVFEWILVNVPAFGILLFMAWSVWKYVSWLNNKFTIVDTTLHNHGFQIDDVNKRTIKLEDQVEKVVEEVHKVQTQLAVLDMKMEQKFEKVDQSFEQMYLKVADRFQEVDRRFTEIDRKLDKMDKRFELNDQKFQAQQTEFNQKFQTQQIELNQKFNSLNEFNLKMLSLLESTIKNNSQSSTNPDLRIQKL